MALLGYNGGLRGKPRIPSTGNASGLWDLEEQKIAKWAGIWPSASDDPYWANVSLLLHMDGSNGSTALIDSSSNAIPFTANLDAQISTAQSKFGGSSAYFDGNGDSFSTVDSSSFYFDTDDFTVECWVYMTGLGAYNGIIDTRISPSFDNMVFGIWNIAGTLRPDHVSSNTGARLTTTSTSVSLNTWTHIAWTRDNGTISCFVNGVKDGTTVSNSGVIAPSSATAYIGQVIDPNYFHGYIDEVRVTKGISRYNANFTPPTAPFPDNGLVVPTNNISLLLHMDGSNGSTTFTDSSSNATPVKAIGNAQISTDASKFGGSSGLFDGWVDHIKISPSGKSRFDGDFTLELWIYPLGVSEYIVGSSAMDGNTQIFRLNEGNVGNLSFYLNGYQVFSPTAAGIVPDAWQHLALSRSGNSTRMFVNGTQIGSENTSWTGAFRMDVIGTFYFQGTRYNVAPPFYDFYGYIDDVRITKGVAYYTTNFTPPTAPFPNS